MAEGGCFVLTMHPFLTGRPSRAAALDRLLERMQAIDGLWIATLGEIAAHVETLDLPPVRHTPPPLDAGPPGARATAATPNTTSHSASATRAPLEECAWT